EIGGLLRRREAVTLDRTTVMGRSICDKEPVHVTDLQNAGAEFPLGRELALKWGHRTILGVPLIREAHPLRPILVRRTEVRPVEDKHIALLKTFADQAAIAIENTRLLNELRESLQQQTATADVLKVISRSTFELQKVLDTLVASAAQLCNAYDAAILLCEGNSLVFKAHHGPLPIDFVKLPISRGWASGRAVTDRKPVQVRDLSAERDEFPEWHELVLRQGLRTTLSVPLLRENEAIGSLAVRRAEVQPFNEKQIELAETFADQAVIAIENVRLFDEGQAQKRELSEALAHQTATSEVLNVITRSPTDAQPVFDAIVQSAARLCEAMFSLVFLYDGDLLRLAATHNFTPEVLRELLQTYPKRPDRSVLAGRAVLDGRIAHVPDLLADREYSHQLALAGNWRAGLAVPMLRDGKAVGAISVARAEAVPFSERQIQLLTTFADQAVIAIENVRLFTELQASNRDL